MKSSDSHYIGILLEEINERLRGMNEGINALTGLPRRMTSLEYKVDELIISNKAIRAAVKDQSKALNSHKVRLAKLETA